MVQCEISELDEALADYCHVISNARRNLLIRILGQGPRTVTELAELTGFSPPNISQHLKLLRAKRIVAVQREGGYARYRLTEPAILEAVQLMREALTAMLKRSAMPVRNLEADDSRPSEEEER